ncbi:hypothetical protein LIP_0096 [Limnochorda pilosa]|uniref:P pilus assembly protein, chaperone PapD n=1 Tax=Limnochorda pilosa TaxID=1555112 RepID=A0A0K2SFR9_LIMPI|nr:hypothetical protein LIP_0096 [Limnochorda pilosa]
MRRTLPLLLAVLVAWVAPGAAAIRVDQLEVHLEVPAGETEAGTLVVTNQRDSAERIRIYVQDWRRDEQGQHQFLEPGSMERSASGWIRLTPTEFTLGPGESRTVRYSFAVPEGASGSYWTVVFVQGEPRPVPGGGTQIRVASRVGVKFYEQVPGSGEGRGKITGLEADGSGSFTAAVRFTNEGDLPLTPQGWVEIRGASGETVARYDVEAFPVLPGDQRLLTVSDPARKLEPGTYLVLAVLDYGGATRVGGQTRLEVR